MRLLPILIALALASPACGGTPCEEAQDITRESCDLREPDALVDDGSREQGACEGRAERLAECAVDHQEAYCEVLRATEDFNLTAAGNPANAYNACTARVDAETR